MQSNDKSHNLYPRDQAFPGSEYALWPHSDDEADQDDLSSVADPIAGPQPADQSDSLATLNRFDAVWNGSSAMSAGAGSPSQRGPRSMSPHQSSDWRESSADGVHRFLGEAAAATPSNVRIWQQAEVSSRSAKGAGDDKAMESGPQKPAVGCKAKRQSTPPRPPARKGRARSIANSGGAENAIFERDRHSPGRHRANNDQPHGATSHQQTIPSEPRRSYPKLVILKGPSDRQSADNPSRGDLERPERNPNRSFASASVRAAQCAAAKAETTSTVSTADRSTRSSNSKRSGPTTDMTSDQGIGGTASTADLVTATSNLTVTSPARTRSDADETRYPCPWSLRYPGRDDKQQCAGQKKNGFGGMGHVKDHIERQHLKEDLTCSVPGCPKRGKRLWQSIRKGNGKDKIRLGNGCPHDHLHDIDYVWPERWEKILEDAKGLDNVARWKSFYGGLFPRQAIPNPLSTQCPTTPGFRQQGSSALDDISRIVLEEHDEEVYKLVAAEVSHLTDNVELQRNFMSLMLDKQQKVRDIREGSS